jgi:cytochrome c peroxidase
VERDARPERWYPHAEKFDDLPARHRANVNRDPPFGRATLALSDAELDDLLAFLGTLEGGFIPPVR